VFAVEPKSGTYEIPLENLKGLSDAGRCSTIRAAVWSSTRALAPDSSVDATRYSAFAVREHGQLQDATIRGLSMEQVIAQSGFEFVDLLKVDIERAETELLKGDTAWLDQIGAIAIEFHGDSRASSSFDRIVGARGFRILDEGDHTVPASR
jgi:FkbM family methyltransferase